MLRPTELRQLGFQLRHLGPEDELAMGQYAIQPPPQISRDTRLLRLQVEKRDSGHGRFTTGIGPSALCSNSVTSRPSKVSARRGWPPRQAAAISSIARPTMAGSAVRGLAINRPG